jgi:hypothetical protein
MTPLEIIQSNYSWMVEPPGRNDSFLCHLAVHDTFSLEKFEELNYALKNVDVKTEQVLQWVFNVHDAFKNCIQAHGAGVRGFSIRNLPEAGSDEFFILERRLYNGFYQFYRNLLKVRRD